MLSFMRRHSIDRFRRDISGVTAVEFAMIFPVFIALIIGVVEFSVKMFIDATMENAVLQASRYGITGSVVVGVTREEKITATIKENLYQYINTDDVVIETLVYDSFADIGEPEPYADANGNGIYDAGETFTDVNGNGAWDVDMGAAGLGEAGEIVLYRVKYTSYGITGFLGSLMDNMQHEAVVAVRNEPF